MNVSLDMTNIYGTDEYKERRAYAEPVFAPEYRGDDATEDLPHSYRLTRHTYAGQVGEFSIHATENFLYDPAGNQIYHYRNVNDSAEFATIISHSNGGLYFIFRVDLYGYGVFHLQTGEEFIHIPRESETFIWSHVDYNAKNNILAVSGCYWARPYSTVLLDFSNPMCQTEWIDLHGRLDGGFWVYDDIDFVGWDDDMLIVEALQSDKKTVMRIPKSQYDGWMNHTTVTLYRPVNQAELEYK